MDMSDLCVGMQSLVYTHFHRSKWGHSVYVWILWFRLLCRVMGCFKRGIKNVEYIETVLCSCWWHAVVEALICELGLWSIAFAVEQLSLR